MLKLSIRYEEPVHIEVNGVKFEILIEKMSGTQMKFVANAPMEVLIYRDKVKKKMDSGESEILKKYGADISYHPDNEARN